jgi:hypothetical protein
MEQYFGIRHNRKTFYKMDRHWLGLKEEVEHPVMKFAQECYSFDYYLLF